MRGARLAVFHRRPRMRKVRFRVARVQWRHDGLSLWALLHKLPPPPTIAPAMYWFIVLLK